MRSAFGKKKNATPLYIPVLWFITTALWAARLWVDMQNGDKPNLLDITVVLMSLICAVKNLISYLRDKKAEQEK